MRFTFVALFVSLTALAAPKVAPKPVVALLPAASSSIDLKKLGLLIEARASELIESSGKTSELHLRQVLAMADAENLDPAAMNDAKTAALARAALGADVVVTMTLETKGKALLLSGVVLEAQGKSTPFSKELSAAWPDALVVGSEVVAGAVLGAPVRRTSTQPESKSAEALLALADCYAVIVRQPMAIETPAVLEPGEIDAAVTSCRKAVEADPTLHFAQATLALALAVDGDDVGATKALASLADADDTLEPYSLARFWLLTRYQSNEAGLAYLRSIVAKHPSEVIARAALAQTLALLNDNVKAVDAWNEVLAMAPNSPVALGQLSRAQFRAGKRAQSLVTAKKAFELAPLSRDARLQLASRYIDVSKPDEAIALLQPLTDSKDARGEPLLRLGWAYWLKGDPERAAGLYQAALDTATAASEWRTRGRAFYNLALVEAKRGHTDAAKVALKASLQTGFRMRQLDASLVSVSREVERTGAQSFDGGNRVALVPRESSLFPLDLFGDVEPSAKKPPPPEGLVLFRF
jgi:tetratricopeptide (TPR) repeat protein